MIRRLGPVLAILAAAGAWPARAQDDPTASGDAAAGERAFRACVSCHVVRAPDGEVLAGRASRTGPNLYGVVGRRAGQVEDFRYSDLMILAGEAGLVWDEASFVPYVQDPTGHLRAVSGESSGRGKMTYRVRPEADAADLYAYLAQFGATSPDR